MSILKRTVLYKKDDKGQYRFPGWALTITTLGTCLEPFLINDRQVANNSFRDFDPSDPIARVDDLQRVDDMDELKATSLGETMVTGGGDLLPRVFIKTGNF